MRLPEEYDNSVVRAEKVLLLCVHSTYLFQISFLIFEASSDTIQVGKLINFNGYSDTQTP